MKVYKHGAKEQETTVIVQPGRDFPDVKSWMTERRDDEGVMRKVAVVFNVKFEGGCAEVDGNLGKYMLDKELAEETPIIKLEKLRGGVLSYDGLNPLERDIAGRTQVVYR